MLELFGTSDRCSLLPSACSKLFGTSDRECSRPQLWRGTFISWLEKLLNNPQTAHSYKYTRTFLLEVLYLSAWESAKSAWWLSGKAQLPFLGFGSSISQLVTHISHTVWLLYVWHWTSDVYLDVVSPPGDMNNFWGSNNNFLLIVEVLLCLVGLEYQLLQFAECVLEIVWYKRSLLRFAECVLEIVWYERSRMFSSSTLERNIH